MRGARGVRAGIADYYRRLVDGGVEIAVPLAERAYGMTDFGVRDPSGNRIDVGEATAA